jgi:hypothetical protein
MKTKENKIGALAILLDGKSKEFGLIDSCGCDFPSNPTMPKDEVHVYYADNIKEIKTKPGTKVLTMHGNFWPEHLDARDRDRKNSDKALETYGEESIEINLGSSVETLKLWGIGKIEIDYCDINYLEFHKDCKLESLIFNCTYLGRHKTDDKWGHWPETKNFSSYDTKYYDDFEFPDAKSNLYGNLIVDRKHKNRNDFFVGRSLGSLRGEFNVGFANGFYYGFGKRFNQKQLIEYCSEVGFNDVLTFFGLKPSYPIKKRKYATDHSGKYLCNNEWYDHEEEAWIKTPYKTVECYKGIPVLKPNTWVPTRDCMSNSGAYCYTYLDPATNLFMCASNDDGMSYELLSKERYEHLIKSLETYYGPNWRNFVEPGDVTSDDGVFSGQLLTETGQEFRKIKKIKIEELDWSLVPNHCNILTMTQAGVWWGNEKSYGLRAEGGSWKTYGGTGYRWVNVCEDIGIKTDTTYEIEPVEDWTKMYERPAKYKVQLKPKKKDFGLCPFSGSGRDPEKPVRICSRTEDGSKGDCSTCRVASDWEEAYG